MNTLKTIYKSFLIVGSVALGLAIALGLLCRIYWGGVSTEDSLSEDTVVLLGESVVLDDITEAANYSPMWIRSQTIDMIIQLDNGEDGHCILTYDEATREFSAIGTGKGMITLSSRLDESVTFNIPFETKFTSGSILSLVSQESKDGVVTAEEIASVEQVRIADAQNIDVFDLKYFTKLHSIVIEADAEVLYPANMDAVSESVIFYVPKVQYGAYMTDDQWRAFSMRTFPDMGREGCTLVLELNGGQLNGYQAIGDSYFDVRNAGENINIANYSDIQKTGYTFLGWAISSDGGEHFSAAANEDTVINANMKIYAQWAENEYTIQYNLNGSGVTPASIPDNRVKYSQETTIFADPVTRTGYTFGGWAESENATVPTYNAGDTVSKLRTENNGTVQLYAIWEANEYAIYYYELSDTNYQNRQNMVYDEMITIQDAASTKTGYTFAGWTTAKGSSNVVYKPGQQVKNLTTEEGSRVSLYAVWEPIEYSVFYYSYGDAENMPKDQKVKYDTSFALPTTVPQRIGYTFLGWSPISYHGSESYDSLPSGGYEKGATLSNLADTENAIVMIYAVWKADTFKIILNSNNGSGSKTTISATYDEALTIDPKVFTKTNYALVGWSVSSSATEADFDVDRISKAKIDTLYRDINSSKEVTLYAIWKPIYTIEYNANGGKTTPEKQTAVGGESISLAGAIEKTGYIFDGWENNKKLYDAGERVKDLTTTAGGNVVLTAKWSPIKYKISYDLNGASGSIANLSMEYDVAKKISQAPTREGYTFGGWEYDGEIYQASESVKNLTTKNGEVIVMKAIWTAK